MSAGSRLSVAKDTTKTVAAVAKPLTAAEFALPVATVVTLYGSLMWGLHYYHGQLKAAAALEGGGLQPHWGGGLQSEVGNYWGTLPSAWDHPEPNYLVSEAIGEFWSVLTTIPVAGVMLMYVGVKYSYGAKVLRIYFLTCCMYTLAFSAHLTLQKVIFSTTVTAVMSNAFLTFLQFSSVVHRVLKSGIVRGLIVFAAEIALVSTVVVLPYKIVNGGVWTLFAVQSPGVFIATGLAGMLLCYAKNKAELATYRTVFFAGCLLSTAMVLSLVECLYGFDHGILHNFWGFPWLHICIHVFEQVGIYFFGVGTSALQELLFEDEPREGAELRYVTALGPPYLYCPCPRGTAQKAEIQAEPVAAATPTTTADEASSSSEELTKPMAPAVTQRPLPDHGLQKRKRNATPGPPVVRSGAM